MFFPDWGGGGNEVDVLGSAENWVFVFALDVVFFFVDLVGPSLQGSANDGFQIHYRQKPFLGRIAFQLQMHNHAAEELIAFTETDLCNGISLENSLLTDTDSLLNSN